MQLVSEDINQYCETHTTAETPVLFELNRQTHLNVMQPRMLSGHLQGAFLSMISHMLKPLNVLEIGTFTGYSAICLAAGIQPEGKLHTIEINEEFSEMISSYIAEAGLENLIVQHKGDAIDIIPGLSEQFDLVFIDADKVNYARYYDLVFDKVNPGGYIIADNVLWSGKVINQTKDKDTEALDMYNKKIMADERVENVLLPMRDGLMIARKIE